MPLFPVIRAMQSRLGLMLSGGQQQVLAIARGLIRTSTREGTAILLVERSAYMARRAAQRGNVLETGKIVLEDSAAYLLTDERMRRAYLGAKIEG